MKVIPNSLIGCAMIASLACSNSAYASNTTKVGAHLFVEDECIVADMPNLADGDDGEQSAIGIASILAGIGGEVAGSLFNGLGQAIQSAAAEHAYSATGTNGFYAGQFRRQENIGSDAWVFEHQARCLILAVFSSGSSGHRRSIQDLANKNVTTDISNLGLPVNRSLSAYLEIAMIPEQDGLRFQTLGAHYFDPIGGSGRRTGNVGVVIELATPSFNQGENGIVPRDQLGNLFALLHYQLPTIRPRSGEQSLTSSELGGIGNIWVPRTPETGAIENRLRDLNAIETDYGAARDAFLKAQRAANAEDAGAEQRTALDNARRTVFESCLAYQSLRSTNSMCGDAAEPKTPAMDYPAIPDGNKLTAQGGAINARVSFIVTRRPNRFLQAIGDALADDDRQTAVEQYVSGRIYSPEEPEWDAEDTAYLTAMLTVTQQETNLTAIRAEGDLAKIQAAELELLRVKGAANVAAIAADEELPFPDLLSSLGG